jgi:hypothetical protein
MVFLTPSPRVELHHRVTFCYFHLPFCLLLCEGSNKLPPNPQPRLWSLVLKFQPGICDGAKFSSSFPS